jgi:hypothetical protein
MKPTPTERDNLVKALIAARVGAKVPVSRVAFRARVSHVAVLHVENGHNLPAVRILRAYAALCGMDGDALLLSWGYVPEDVIQRLQQNPQLCAMVRGA